MQAIVAIAGAFFLWLICVAVLYLLSSFLGIFEHFGSLVIGVSIFVSIFIGAITIEDAISKIRSP